jgi:hypothetical protein
MQGVDGSGILVTSGAGERVDGNPRVVAESGAWSSSSISSSGKEGERLEAVRAPVARVVVDSVVGLQKGTKRECHNVLQRERK